MYNLDAINTEIVQLKNILTFALLNFIPYKATSLVIDWEHAVFFARGKETVKIISDKHKPWSHFLKLLVK